MYYYVTQQVLKITFQMRYALPNIKANMSISKDEFIVICYMYATSNRPIGYMQK